MGLYILGFTHSSLARLGPGSCGNMQRLKVLPSRLAGITKTHTRTRTRDLHISTSFVFMFVIVPLDSIESHLMRTTDISRKVQVSPIIPRRRVPCFCRDEEMEQRAQAQAYWLLSSWILALTFSSFSALVSFFCLYLRDSAFHSSLVFLGSSLSSFLKGSSRICLWASA
jgi:hypothetical protein